MISCYVTGYLFYGFSRVHLSDRWGNRLISQFAGFYGELEIRAGGDGYKLTDICASFYRIEVGKGRRSLKIMRDFTGGNRQVNNA